MGNNTKITNGFHLVSPPEGMNIHNRAATPWILLLFADFIDQKAVDTHLYNDYYSIPNKNESAYLSN